MRSSSKPDENRFVDLLCLCAIVREHRGQCASLICVLEALIHDRR
jgi:hypothetical protein